VIAKQTVHLPAWAADVPVTATAVVTDPVLWSPESPVLYRLATTIERPGKGRADGTETEFGMRTIAFDATNGFLLNGRPYVIKGTCNHQDHAGVGVALLDALQDFRIAQLKEMGCNAIRTSHNAPTPELLNACDHLGMLVMDENRLLGSDTQNMTELAAQVRRDRNHPSVFIWSLANEEEVQRSAAAGRVFDSMQRLVHRLDPTRLCTAAMNSWSGESPDGFSTVMDVQGFNYLNNGDMDAFHRSNPAKPAIGTEEASAFYTRGIYTNTDTYDSAYDDNKPGYGATAEEWWKYYSARPWASGAFVWTGFDYRGEPSPFGWPNISSEFGILDTCGFPKDVFYYYQSWWRSDKTVLHLMPHWNWPGREGQNIDVRCFSNCDEVELFLNGVSLGKKAMPRNSHLQWLVRYAPGTLLARGYKDGRMIAEDKVETTGAPTGIQLTPDRATIRANGQDLSIVTVAVTDAKGRLVPVANNEINFELTGPGKIIGVGNGDPICHEPDVYVPLPRLRGMPLTDWNAANVAADSGPLKPGESAVYRTRVTLTAADVASANIVLNFGMIDDDGWIYVNGHLVGESHDWRVDPACDVRNAVRVGDNTIAVVVKNNEGQGGLNRGASLEFESAATSTPWRRSVFNGLAQVIVQSEGQPGEIHLTARAKGLADANLDIQTQSRP
jgi:beta-galactosidase